jgi:hypothetical protein
MDHPDSSTGPGTGSPVARFSPPDDPLPPPLDSPPSGDEAATLLVAAGESGDWAADTAIAIASQWAAGGRRVVLMDLHLEAPVLHERVGSENLEGTVDVFLYGASLARSARLVEGRGFYLISAGTFTSDPGAIHRSGRWQKLVDGFREANAVLLVFAPGDADRLALETWLPNTVVLGDGGAGDGRAPLATLVPDGTERAAATVPPPAVEEVTPAETPPPAQAVEEPLQGTEEPPADIEPELPPPASVSARRRRKAGGKVPTLLWIILAIVLLAGAAATLWFLRPDLFPLPGANGTGPAVEDGAPVGAAAADAPGDPEPLAVPLPVSVQVRTYSSLRSAREEVGQAARRDRETEFFVAPEVVEGALYYKIFAGAFPDTVTAAMARDRLVERGIADAEEALGGWSLVRAVPYAFDLGQFASRAEAARQADALLDQGVPAYTVRIRYSDGGERWQLYGGAYPGEDEAMGMRRLLEEASVTASLVERTGSPSEA